MFKITCFIISALVAVTMARMRYEFAADVTDYLSAPLQTIFDCEGRPYGYYADMDNNCEIFHVCVPIADHEGIILRTDQYSFVCGNATLFNQESLTCSHPEEAFPCDQASTLYDLVNSEFGRIPDRHDDQF